MSIRRWNAHLPFVAASVLAAACAAAAPPRAGGEAGSANAMPEWFHAPCLADSVDDFGWPRYELHGISIRVPADFRRETLPSPDELHFRRGTSSLRLLLRLDASRIFASYAESAMRYRYCEGEVGGRLAEAVSFRAGLDYGFAARWADAARGEWLSAVIVARTAAEATVLREALFTLRFPGQGG
ncbi:MAG TPA: hypothetical protein VLE53_02140 [Gemmatimonadaceae bacterium]|nr:hypothetical protein [Gemmatimonadaceae bacterium]